MQNKVLCKNNYVTFFAGLILLDYLCLNVVFLMIKYNYQDYNLLNNCAVRREM